MNYRHAYHAGNFADVLKHTAMISILAHLQKKDAPFAVIDTHAGRGSYDLSADAAQKTGEANSGVARIMAASALPPALEAYRACVAGFDGVYPGSPLIAARSLRSRDRLLAIEKHEDEFAALQDCLRGFSNAGAEQGDGYQRLLKSVPPPERRGLVLIDPPFEAEDEFSRAVAALSAAHRRFATGIYLLWYPVKAMGAVELAAGELRNAGLTRLMRLTLDIGASAAPQPADRGPRLSASGLLVVNAPYGFADSMREALPVMADLLAQGPGAKGGLEVLSGEE